MPSGYVSLVTDTRVQAELLSSDDGVPLALLFDRLLCEASAHMIEKIRGCVHYMAEILQNAEACEDGTSTTLAPSGALWFEKVR